MSIFNNLNQLHQKSETTINNPKGQVNQLNSLHSVNPISNMGSINNINSKSQIQASPATISGITTLPAKVSTSIPTDNYLKLIPQKPEKKEECLDYIVEPIKNSSNFFNPHYICFSCFKIKNIICKVIEFHQENKKNVDCDFCLIKINFLENLIEKETLIFKSIIQVFENLKIELPLEIYLNYENKRYHLYFKLKNPKQDLLSVTNKFIQFINNLNKLIKFSKDVDFKILKKENNLEKSRNSCDSNYNNLNNLNDLAAFTGEKKKKLSKVDLFIPFGKVSF